LVGVWWGKWLCFNKFWCNWIYIFWYKNETSDWIFITNSSGTLYVDANASIPNQYPVYYNGTDYFIGKTNDTTFFNGSISDIIVYNNSITDIEVKALYSIGRTGDSLYDVPESLGGVDFISEKNIYLTFNNDTYLYNSTNIVMSDYNFAYNASNGTEQYYINDHAIIQNSTGTWHMFGITAPSSNTPPFGSQEDQFAHATSDILYNASDTQYWKQEDSALITNESLGETSLWAPYVIENDGTYYMYYCSGGTDIANYRISLATSTDLFNWTRYNTDGLLFTDGLYARDPFVMKYNSTTWIMYYTANLNPLSSSNHTIAYRFSDNPPWLEWI